MQIFSAGRPSGIIVHCYEKVESEGSYIVLNVSCPNTSDGKTFEDLSCLRDLLAEITRSRNEFTSRAPILIKFSSDISLKQLERVLPICESFGVDGYVLTNSSLARDNLQTDPRKHSFNWSRRFKWSTNLSQSSRKNCLCLSVASGAKADYWCGRSRQCGNSLWFNSCRSVFDSGLYWPGLPRTWALQEYLDTDCLSYLTTMVLAQLRKPLVKKQWRQRKI